MKKIKKVVCPQCENLIELKKNKKGEWIGTITGGGLGLFSGAGIGSTIGIALLGTAIAGTIPLAVIGTVFLAGTGKLIGKKLTTFKCPKCGRKIEF